MKLNTILFCGLLIGCMGQLQAQQWAELMQDPNVNFYTVQQAFQQAWGNQPYVRGRGWKQYKRWEYFMEERVFPHGKRPKTSQAWEEYQKFRARYEQTPTAASRAANWTPLGPASWTNVSGWNPGNGRINCVTQDPVNPNVVYSGAPAGGLWKSTNGGNSWVCLTDQLPILGVSAILIDPTNTNTIYIGTGDGDGSDTYSIGVLKSTDGGATWNTTGLSWTIGNSRLIRRMIMHPTNNQIILAATNDGVYRTTDGGATWLQTQPGSMRDIEFKPGDPNTVYAATDQFYKSTNGGISFTQITTGLPAATSVNRASIAVTAANPNYVYVLFGDETDSGFFGLYRSTNSGASFSLRSNAPNIFTYDELGADTGGQSWYDMALAVSPSNAEEVYSGGINVWKSLDGGNNWYILTHWVHPATLGYVHADIHTLDFFGNSLYCGSDGGLSRTVDTGATWTNLSTGMEIMQFYRFGVSAQNAYQMIGGAQDNGTNYLNAGIWEHVLGADGMEAAIDYSNSLIMYGETQGGGMNRSTDGGQTWSDITPSNPGNASWVTPYIIDPNTPATLYAGYEEVWKSTNRGNSWTQISNFGTGTSLTYIAAAKSNSNYIYVGHSGDLYKTTNGGTSWTTITPNLPGGSAIKYIVVHPTNEQRIWICLSGYNAGEKVFYSPDAGATWQNISGNLPNLPINCIEYQAGSADALYVGTDVGVYYKDSTLANWQSYMTGLPNVMVYELEIHYGVNKLRAATFGRGVWESDLFTPSPFPPAAAFNYSTNAICVGDSVQFYDQSTNAAPGWQWFFPGGSPASSTLQNPKVSYSAPGSYTAILVVSNVNGTDTITQNVTINFANNQVRVNIMTDNYPEESSWEITDSAGNVVASGGPYSAGATIHNESVCLPDGCYTFTMSDSYGDGMCCAYGNGSYEVLDSANTVLATGGQFTNNESTTFCFNHALPVQVTQAAAVQSGCGMNNGTITISASGGNNIYQYSIDGTNYQTSNVFASLAPGTYMVYVRDGLGQIDTDFATVTEAQGPTAVANSSNPNVFLNSGANVNFSGILSSNASAYSWTFGDGATANTMATSHTYSAAGTYTVVLTAYKDNCTSTDTIIVTVGLTNGINNPQQNPLLLDVLPNPVAEQFIVAIEFPSTEDELEIFIHNALGQLVHWEKIYGPLQQVRQNLNFANEPAGVYTLSVQSKNYRQFRQFVKVK